MFEVIDPQCRKPFVRFKRDTLPAESDVVKLEDFEHVDGRPVEPAEPLACDSCGRQIDLYQAFFFSPYAYPDLWVKVEEKNLMDIDSLPAGRKLNGLVAEKVMEWRTDYDSYHDWQEMDEACLADVRFTRPGSMFTGEQSIADISDYSTDIAAAWLVVEAMLQHNGRMGIITGIDGYRVSFFDIQWHGRPYSVGEAIAETAPLAICRAALKAVGKE